LIGILGAGLTGCALAAYLRQPCVVLEADAEVGGLCRTVRDGARSYDLGPHIIFSRDRKLLDEITSVLGVNWHERPRLNEIRIGDRHVGWPLENHLGDLAPEDRSRCLRDYVRNAVFSLHNVIPSGFDSWCRYMFGDAIAELYLLPYNRKLWKRDPS
jgi:protoporphyrinogen oxidase